jgi:hypothetical protein
MGAGMKVKTDSTGLRWGRMLGFYEYGDVPRCYIKVETFLSSIKENCFKKILKLSIERRVGVYNNSTPGASCFMHKVRIVLLCPEHINTARLQFYVARDL